MIHILKKSLRLLTILAAMLAGSSASAQTLDATNYSVRIDPYMQLDSLSPDRSANHPFTPANLSFTNQLWFARTSSTTGSTIRWTTDHAFRNTADPGYRRDARLRLTRLVGSAVSSWQFDTAQDQTNYAAGDETAAVQISSRRAGNAIIWMDVTFITGDLATLRGGQYEMTVTGTISAN